MVKATKKQEPELDEILANLYIWCNNLLFDLDVPNHSQDVSLICILILLKIKKIVFAKTVSSFSSGTSALTDPMCRTKCDTTVFVIPIDSSFLPSLARLVFLPCTGFRERDFRCARYIRCSLQASVCIRAAFLLPQDEGKLFPMLVVKRLTFLYRFTAVDPDGDGHTGDAAADGRPYQRNHLQ